MIFTSVVVGLTAAGVGAVLYTIRKDKQRNPEVVQSLRKQESIGEHLEKLYAKQAAAKRTSHRPLKPRKKAKR